MNKDFIESLEQMLKVIAWLDKADVCVLRVSADGGLPVVVISEKDFLGKFAGRSGYDFIRHDDRRHVNKDGVAIIAYYEAEEVSL